ncbi:unnamed protein product [Penicillium discolor]
MSTEARTISRTRPSFTCLPCKRRKIKCEKQRPACRDCRRLNDVCVYPPVTTSDEPKSAEGLPRRNIQIADQHHASAFPLSTPLHNNGKSVENTPANNEINNDTHPTNKSRQDEMAWVSDTFDLLDDSTLSLIDPPVDFYEFGTLSVGPPPSCLPALSYPFSVIDQSSLWPTPQSSTPILSREPPDITKKSNADTSSNLQESSQLIGSPQGDLRRYMGHSFWALAANQTVDRDVLPQAEQLRCPTQEDHGRNSGEWTRMLQSLPPKKVCDVLLESFLLSVKPLLPLVHVPTLLRDYEAFWEQAATHTPVNQESKNGSFVSLQWSVLYCGMVAVSPSLLAESGIQMRDSCVFIKQLRLMLERTLFLSHYAEQPTLNGFIAVLLAWECDPIANEILAAPAFVSQAMQVARTLGLHHEESIMSRGEVEAELARRVWYHVVFLELYACVASGSVLSYGTQESSYNTQLPQSLHDSFLDSGRSTRIGVPSVRRTSTAMLMLVGRCRMTRTLRCIMELGYKTRPLSTQECEILETEIRQFEVTINGLINQIVARGVPEQGYLSSQLLRVNHQTHPHYYHDTTDEETVLNAYARIQLDMMKQYVRIFFNRQVLAGSSGSSTVWDDQIIACRQFLKNYVNLARLPAFSPYWWLCPGKLQPLHECLIAITCMKERPQNPDTQILLYLLSEIFEIFKSTEARDDSLLSQSFRRYKAPWQKLQQRLDETTTAYSLNATSRSLEPPLQENDDQAMWQQPSLSRNEKRLRPPDVAAITERAAEPLPDEFRIPVSLHPHKSTSSFDRSSKRRKSSRSCSTSSLAPIQTDMGAGWPLGDWSDPNRSVRTVPLSPRSSVSNYGGGDFSNFALTEMTPPDMWEKRKPLRADDVLHELPTDWADLFNA